MGRAQLTVLIVEDDLVYQRIVALQLRAEGCLCLTASSHEEALACLRAHAEIDVILLDYSVRGSGPAPLLEEWERMARQAVIVGHSSMDRTRVFAAFGVDKFARKPLDLGAFLRVAGVRACAEES